MGGDIFAGEKEGDKVAGYSHRLKFLALITDNDVEGIQMISFLIVIACCAVGALLLSVRIKASPMVNLGLIFLFTSGGVFFHSPYLMGKVADKYVPMSRPKQIERRLEGIYISDQSGGRANLVVDYKKATADIKTGSTTGLRRLGDPEQLQRAKLILTLAKLSDD